MDVVYVFCMCLVCATGAYAASLPSSQSTSKDNRHMHSNCSTGLQIQQFSDFLCNSSSLNITWLQVLSSVLQESGLLQSCKSTTEVNNFMSNNSSSTLEQQELLNSGFHQTTNKLNIGGDWLRLLCAWLCFMGSIDDFNRYCVSLCKCSI